MSPRPPTLPNSPAQPIQRRAMLAWLSLWPGLPAIAQRPARIASSMARNEQDYRKDAARHLYAMYPAQVLKGMVRANVYAIMVTETTVDANGKVLSVHVLRNPAEAHEVTPWVVALIRQASPLPPLLHLMRAGYVETWLVDQSGQFQVRTLTEGQL